jgi:hypothetical protein
MNAIERTGIDELLTQEELEKYPDLLSALRYLLLKESTPKRSMDEIVDLLANEYPSMPTTRPGLYYRIETWRRNGTLRRAEELFIIPKLEEYRHAVAEVITAYPDMLRRLIKEAKEGRSGKNALDIIVFLTGIVDKEMSNVLVVGDVEVDYAKKEQKFNPMSIVED